MEWYYADATNQQVPFKEEDFKSLIDRGVIGSETLVWNNTMPDWRKAAQVQPLLFRSQTPALTPIPPSNYYQNQPQVSDGLGIASMVCGILAVLAICAYGFSIFPGIAAIICGHKSRKNMLDLNPPGNTAFSTAGLIMGYIGTGLGLIFGIAMIIAVIAAVGAGVTQEMVPE
jgi:GYF domain 2/Domain of unknown function (DUF4190)